MRMYDLIEKKKRGHALDKAEICWMIQSYTAGQIPDYQMAAFLMAVCFQGMDLQETTEMTLAMGAGIVGPNLALSIVETFLNTPFSGDEKHVRRINKIEEEVK